MVCLLTSSLITLILLNTTFASQNTIKKEIVEGYNPNMTIKISESDLYRDIIGKSDIIPWSWDWQPYRDNTIISALRKYGEYIEKNHPDFGIKTRDIIRWEEMYHTYKYAKAPLFSLLDWQGHCDGLAAASVLFAEPIKGGEIAGIKFKVSDIKALLVESSLMSQAKILGNGYRDQRLYGIDRESEKRDFKDINPCALTKILFYYLKENKLPVIFDFNSNEVVHNHPVYEFVLYFTPKWESNLLMKEKNWVRATLDVVYAGYADLDFEGSDNNKNKRAVKSYYFDLELNKDKIVIGGNWAERMVEDEIEKSRRSRLRSGFLQYLQRDEACDRIPNGFECGTKILADVSSINDHPDFAWVPYGIDNSNIGIDQNHRNPYLRENILNEILWGIEK